MDEATKKLSTELALELKARFESQEVKDAVESTKAASDTGTFEVVITTENVDRYQEVIKLDGWELEHYRANPVVLWGHNHYELPIGIATDIRVEDGKMIARGKFASHAKAQEIRKLYDLGMMRATSVGFIVKEQQGSLITKAELLEFSFVSIPANPYALSTLVKSGMSIDEVVTKGFMSLKETEIVESPGTEPAVEPITTEEVKETPTEAPVVDEPAEKQFNIQEVATQLSALTAAVVALEALVKNQELERNDEPHVETEEEKAFADFSEKRRIIQQAATIFGDVLAEARQAIRK